MSSGEVRLHKKEWWTFDNVVAEFVFFMKCAMIPYFYYMIGEPLHGLFVLQWYLKLHRLKIKINSYVFKKNVFTFPEQY